MARLLLGDELLHARCRHARRRVALRLEGADRERQLARRAATCGRSSCTRRACGEIVDDRLVALRGAGNLCHVVLGVERLADLLRGRRDSALLRVGQVAVVVGVLELAAEGARSSRVAAVMFCATKRTPPSLGLLGAAHLALGARLDMRTAEQRRRRSRQRGDGAPLRDVHQLVGPAVHLLLDIRSATSARPARDHVRLRGAAPGPRACRPLRPASAARQPRTFSTPTWRDLLTDVGVD